MRTPRSLCVLPKSRAISWIRNSCATLWPEAWRQGFWRSEENYLRLFRTCADAVVLGEASTNYTKFPLISGVPERIRSFNPEARFIYVMRDPIERTISHYWHMVTYHAERRPILEAIKAEPQYLDVSHYAMQLMPYLDRFGSDRVAVVSFEQLTRAPVATMRRLVRLAWRGANTGRRLRVRSGGERNAGRAAHGRLAWRSALFAGKRVRTASSAPICRG